MIEGNERQEHVMLKERRKKSIHSSKTEIVAIQCV